MQGALKLEWNLRLGGLYFGSTVSTEDVEGAPGTGNKERVDKNMRNMPRSANGNLGSEATISARKTDAKRHSPLVGRERALRCHILPSEDTPMLK